VSIGVGKITGLTTNASTLPRAGDISALESWTMPHRRSPSFPAGAKRKSNLTRLPQVPAVLMLSLHGCFTGSAVEDLIVFFSPCTYSLAPGRLTILHSLRMP